ncbi:MAG: hypothetical protein KA745_10050, partial [Gemmatimonadales bacterium]|nr:hypothetical protein [Gemmatimonadales bacterium]
MEADFAALRAALEQIGDAIKPIMSVEDGSGRVRPSGSSFLLSVFDARFHVTAAHVVEGPRPKIVGLSPEGGATWPTAYSI